MLLHPWDFPGKSTWVGCHSLLQSIFPTQGLNLGLPHCRQTLYHLSHQGSPPQSVRQSKLLLSSEVDSVLQIVQCFIFFWHHAPCSPIAEPQKRLGEISWKAKIWAFVSRFKIRLVVKSQIGTTWLLIPSQSKVWSWLRNGRTTKGMSSSQNTQSLWPQPIFKVKCFMESCFLILNDLKQGHREVKCFAQYPAVYQQKY